MIRITTKSGPLLCDPSERIRLLMPDDSRQATPAELVRVGDLIEARGKVVAVEVGA